METDERPGRMTALRHAVRGWGASKSSATHRVEFVAYLLVIPAFIGGMFLAFNMRAVTIHQTRTVTLSPAQAVQRMSGAEIVRALGRPDQQQAQNGVTCGVWASKGIEVCWKA